MASAHGYLEPVTWTHFWGEMTDEDVRAYCDHHLARALEARAENRQILGLMFHSQAQPPNAAQRKMMAEAIEAHAETVSAHLPRFIYGFDSALARGTVTAISWLVKKPFAESVHKRASDALAEVRQHFPDADVDALWAQIRNEVPAAWLFPY